MLYFLPFCAYISCGETALEPWQIYKALHSAIQRRGYDPDIPWKAKESRRRNRVRAKKKAERGNEWKNS